MVLGGVLFLGTPLKGLAGGVGDVLATTVAGGCTNPSPRGG